MMFGLSLKLASCRCVQQQKNARADEPSQAPRPFASFLAVRSTGYMPHISTRITWLWFLGIATRQDIGAFGHRNSHVTGAGYAVTCVCSSAAFVVKVEKRPPPRSCILLHRGRRVFHGAMQRVSAAMRSDHHAARERAVGVRRRGTLLQARH